MVVRRLVAGITGGVRFAKCHQRLWNQYEQLCRPCSRYHQRLAHRQLSTNTQNSNPKQNVPFDFPPATCEISQFSRPDSHPPGQTVTLHGYLANQRAAKGSLSFAQLLSSDLTTSIQLVISSRSLSTEHLEHIRTFKRYVPVCVTGVVTARDEAAASPHGIDDSQPVNIVEIAVTSCEMLNDFPTDDLAVLKGRPVPTFDERHLQIRFDKPLRDALRLRSKVSQTIRTLLYQQHDFVEVETPILFKSTPEGAREFLVPTRTQGQAYALPQSPQQFKQLLMAGGIPRYMQIAKCFRDEDQRADRQPEFTQLDLEMAFAKKNDVMAMVEELIKTLWSQYLEATFTAPFDRITYDQAMNTYGSDKPDRRLGSEINRIDHIIPVDMIRKISEVHNPIVEVLKLSPSENSPKGTRTFISEFMSSAAARPFNSNPAGQPGIFIFDAGKPLNGLQPFGFEAAEHLEDLLDLAHGDLVVVQARDNAPHDGGGSTMLGNLRLALHRAAMDADLLPRVTGWDFLWVTDFPLFTPVEGSTSPGSALQSTHHPFTAPSSPTDLSTLSSSMTSDRSSLLSLKAEHYDLVLNGTELGGGSARIHKADLQRQVFTILGLAPERMERDFGHLLRALRAGCPPHAGFALGLDRCLALMLGRESVRDVIAFPKGKAGRDATVGSPAEVAPQDWETYHLQVKSAGDEKSS